MDLEMENRIAAILVKEAAELRQQAEKEGVQVNLRQPQLRGRPNSRFLTATVLGVHQANRAAEVNEMWCVRRKELELDNRLKGRLGDDSSTGRSLRDISESRRIASKRHVHIETSASASCSSSKRVIQDSYSREDESFKDEEIEKFLHSRDKRGRGAVGSRMDETDPHLSTCPDYKAKQLAGHDEGGREEWEHRVIRSPEKPSLLKPFESSEEESILDKRKKADKVSSSKWHSRKFRSKEKSRDKKMRKRKEEKRM